MPNDPMVPDEALLSFLTLLGDDLKGHPERLMPLEVLREELLALTRDAQFDLNTLLLSEGEDTVPSNGTS